MRITNSSPVESYTLPTSFHPRKREKKTGYQSIKQGHFFLATSIKHIQQNGINSTLTNMSIIRLRPNPQHSPFDHCLRFFLAFLEVLLSCVLLE